jgi:glucose/mannose-6-phosphate isomerase
MPATFDEQRLDDPQLSLGDPSGMLRAVATAAAQVRESAAAAATAGLDQAAADGRPRSVIVCGMGGSGIAGDVFAAAVGRGAGVPVIVNRGWDVPSWIGATDLVVGVSCSGSTAETLSAVEQATRRSTRLVGVGAADSPLQHLVEQGRGQFVAVRPQLAPRASLWTLVTPLLVLGAALGWIDLGQPADDGLPVILEAAAARLEELAIAAAPGRESLVNPAKEMARALAEGIPIIWGSGQCGPVAALRLACQLAENAKTAAVHGALPEALHNQVVAFDAAGPADEEFFRDRTDFSAAPAPHLFLLRDDAGDPAAAAASTGAEEVAKRRGLAVTSLPAAGESSIERLASLIALGDFASVYLALGLGIDPTPVRAIDEIKGMGPVS